MTEPRVLQMFCADITRAIRHDINKPADDGIGRARRDQPELFALFKKFDSILKNPGTMTGSFNGEECNSFRR